MKWCPDARSWGTAVAKPSAVPPVGWFMWPITIEPGRAATTVVWTCSG